MAYFKLSLLTKVYDKDNINKYIKNTISEFYGNNIDEDLIKYERENNIISPLQDGLINTYTKTYTYNEKLNLHQQGQAELSFSLDKKILDDDTWKDNPFASKLKSGGQVLLEDKYNNVYLFTIKDVSYTITENNIVYNYSCQDSFSYQLAKQNDGYTINNDINSANFIGALNIDAWAEKIVKECKIAYKYLTLDTPLYLCTDGTVINTTINKTQNKKILKIIKDNYLNTPENADLYETIPFSCSSTTANGALISLGEQVGLVLKTATAFTQPEWNVNNKSNSNFVTLVTYFWFEPAKKEAVSGLTYSPFRDINTFTLSQKADSLITSLNINSRTLSNDEVITALPPVSPFFIKYFDSTYWKKYSQYHKGMYLNTLYGPQFSIDSEDNNWVYGTLISQPGVVYVSHGLEAPLKKNIYFQIKLDESMVALYSLYKDQIFQSGKVQSSVKYIANQDDKRVATADNTTFYIGIDKSTNILTIVVQNLDFENITINHFLEKFEIHIFFRTDYTDEDEAFAKIADQLPWLEDKLIDYSYFIKNGLLSKLQERDISNRINNDLRKINSDILLSAAAYYSRIHNQTKYLADMTNNIDMVGAEVSNIMSSYKKKGANDTYDTSNLITRWNLLQSNVSGAAPANQTGVSGSAITSTFMNLYGTTSDYMRKFLNARQRCLKNLYSFREYFETPLDDIYKKYYEVAITINDSSSTAHENFYRFSPNKNDSYTIFTMDFVNANPNFFIKRDGVLVDFNNIKLYNNDTQHSEFNKENYLITEDNYADMTLHCYRNTLHTIGDHDNYNNNTQYLREVFFIKLSVILDYFTNNGNTLTPSEKRQITESSLFLDIYTSHNNESPVVLYPCRVKMYDKDRNYLICNKLYEDGIPYDKNHIHLGKNSKIIVNNKTFTITGVDNYITLNGTQCRYNGLQLTSGVATSDTTKFTNSSYMCSGFVFYQPIISSDILLNYLYRKKSTILPKIKDKYQSKGLSNLLSPIVVKDVTYEDITPPYTNYSYDNGKDDLDNNSLGWGTILNGTAMGWHIATGIMGLLFPPLWIGTVISGCNLHDKLLVLGGYSSSLSHIKDDYYTQFAPYASRTQKKHSMYVRDFPLTTIYDANDANPITLVTATNYQNFYSRINSNMTNESCNLSTEGTFASLDGYQVAKDKNSLFPDFISDFPKKFFYAKKPVDGQITSVSDTNLAYTFGNLVHNKTTFNSYNYHQEKWYTRVKYNATGTYESIDNLPDDIQLLMIPRDHPELNVPLNDQEFWETSTTNHTLDPYLSYDIINKGTLMSKQEVQNLSTGETPATKDTKYVVYYITNGYLHDFSPNEQIRDIGQGETANDVPVVAKSIEEMFSKDITDNYGKHFNINDFQHENGIVEGLYYIEQDVRMSPDAIKQADGFALRDNLQTNTYEWYNEDDERVYTINQLLGHLLYKNPQTYTYYTFDTTINQYVRLYRYNCHSITPDVINYNFDISDCDVDDHSVSQSYTGYAPYQDFSYTVTITPHDSTIGGNYPTNGDFWYAYTVGYTYDSSNVPTPLLEHAALIESNLQLYWNEARAASLLCDIFVPDEWRIKQDKVQNHFEVVIKNSRTLRYVLNPVYIPKILKNIDKQYIVSWSDQAPQLENGKVYTYEQLSKQQQSEVDKMLEHTQNISTNNLYFTEIADKISYYTIQTGGCDWATFLNQSIGVYIPDYTGWNGIAISYLTSHFVDAGISNYEMLIEKREDLWRSFYEEYPYLFLESSYSNDSATTSEDLLMMAKYAFEDQKYPEKSYSISLIDLVQDVETRDNNDGTRNPQYYYGQELHIGDAIQISAEDYTNDRDDVYEALSQLLFITDISRDLRNDGNCQLTVNTIKYQDKLIRRLAKMIRNNPLY